MFSFLQKENQSLRIAVLLEGRLLFEHFFSYGELVTIGPQKESSIQLHDIEAEHTLFMLTDQAYFLIFSLDMTGFLYSGSEKKESLLQATKREGVIEEFGDFLIPFGKDDRGELNWKGYQIQFHVVNPEKKGRKRNPPTTKQKNVAVGLVLLLLTFSMTPFFEQLHEGIAPSKPHPIIQEVMAANSRTVVDEDGDYSDWIEIWNPHSSPIELLGYGLSDNRLDPFQWVFPGHILKPNSGVLIFASKKNRSNKPFHSNFLLHADAEEVILTDPKGKIIDEISFAKLPMDVSVGLNHVGEKQRFYLATPGEPNSKEEPLTAALKEQSPALCINEISMRADLLDEDGESGDWIELKNVGPTDIDLEGVSLADRKISSWRFPSHTLKAGEVLLVFASGKDRVFKDKELHTDFRLSGSDKLILRSKSGKIIDKIQLPNSIPRSWGRNSKGEWLHFLAATPNRPNQSVGFVQPELLALPKKSNHLQINEVVANNRTGLQDEFGQRHDWVEIKNVSSKKIDLKGYGLSDKALLPFRWRFPTYKLKPGGLALVFLSGLDCTKKRCKKIHAAFKLKGSGDFLQLTAPDSLVEDQFQTGRLHPGISSGRVKDVHGRVFFSRPSPKKENGDSWYRSYTAEPLIDIHKTDEEWELRLSCSTPDAIIRYTLDGSAPDSESERYEEVIRLEKNTVIRARAFHGERLSSSIATRSAINIDKHLLPVISIAVDPHRMFSSGSGLYSRGPNANPVLPHKGANFWKRTELPVHFELFESNGKLGLDMDLGLRIFGGYSRGLDKKSFRLIARDIYGYSNQSPNPNHR